MLKNVSFVLFLSILTACGHLGGAPKTERQPASDVRLKSSDFDRVLCCDDFVNPSVQDYVKGENLRFRQVVDSYPLSAEIKKRNGELAPAPAPTMVELKGRYFFPKAGGLWFKESAGGSEVELVKGKPEEKTVVGDFRVSPDGEKVAYSFVANGTDTHFWSVIEIASKKLVSGPPIRIRLENLTWNMNSSGVFYSKWPATEEEEKEQLATRSRFVEVWFRPLNTDGSQDVKIFSPEERPANRFFSIAELEEGKVFLAHRSQGPAEISLMNYLVRKNGNQSSSERLSRPGQFVGKFLGNAGPTLYFRTTECGQMFCVTSYNYKTKKTKVVVPQWESHNLTAAHFNGRYLSLHYVDKQLASILRVVEAQSGKKVLEYDFRNDFPEGVAYLSSGFVGINGSKKIYISGSSMTRPNTTFEITLEDTVSLRKLDNAKIVDFDESKVERAYVHYQSLDGQRIPMFVYRKKNSTETPKFAYVFFYGAIGTVHPPWWSRKLQMALELGGLVAVPAIRGGGEFGREWTETAQRDRMNTFSDLAAASRFLRRKYGFSTEQIVLSGRSLGGLHVLGAMTHFNEDFGLYFPTVPISDPVDWVARGLFAQFATDDFGFTRDKNHGSFTREKEDIEWVNKWSPFHNVDKMKSIKPVVFFTAENDERVAPTHSYRMALRLQEKFGTGAPIYVFTEPKAGHVARAEAVDEMSFLARHYGIETLQRFSK